MKVRLKVGVKVRSTRVLSNAHSSLVFSIVFFLVYSLMFFLVFSLLLSLVLSFSGALKYKELLVDIAMK